VTLRAYQESPGETTCIYAAKRPQTASVPPRRSAGALLLWVEECGRGRSRGKKSLRFAGRDRRCAGAVPLKAIKEERP
jgi:hypothetical protein